MSTDDPRSRIPRTDALLTSPAAQDARTCLAEGRIQQVVQDVLARARRGDIAPESVEPELSDRLSAERPSRLTPVINATGVVVHTNLGRAPLSPAAAAAVQQASGYVDVEMDLAAGVRSKRGTAARDALLDACPVAEAALVVNNGAAALVLATTALAAGKKVILSRGEFIEIGAGFRLPDLIESTGARLCEVGTTNRTSVADYVDAISEETGCILKVHPSNFRVHGFTRSADVAELRSAVGELPIVHDLGSGLLAPDPTLPHEPDASTALTDGADLVIASGDKLLGGRRQASCWAKPSSSSGWRSTRWPGPSGSTNSPWPRWRRPSPGRRLRSASTCTRTPPSSGSVPRRSLGRSACRSCRTTDVWVAGEHPGLRCRGGRFIYRRRSLHCCAPVTRRS